MRPDCVVSVLTVVATWQAVIGQMNLLMNPSFEEDLQGTWKANGFTMQRTTDDVLDGQYAIICTERDRDLEGPIQSITLIKGHHYVFEGYVKLLNDEPGKLYQNFKAVVQMDLAGQSKKQSYIIAFRAFGQTAKGWIQLKGSIEAPMLEPSNAKLAIRGPNPSIDFLVDNLTLYEVPENPNWLAQSHANIEHYRKSNIRFNLQLPRGRKSGMKRFSLDIVLKRHAFIFGGKIEEYEVVEEPMNLYTKLVYYLFNCATVQAYKWKFNKGGRYDRDFSRAVNATRALRANSMQVRGHSIFWDIQKNVPQWVQDLPDHELYPELVRHVHYMMTLINGSLIQMDVQNEPLHGQYYEERLQDPEVTKNMFRLARDLSPDTPDLYLNDFTCITSGASTEELHDLGAEYVREGVPIDGLGIQGHTKDFVRSNPTAMWRRIDRLAETGLDLMMTEFDLGWPDEVERADWFEDAIRAFFSHPAMKGVILWGFWNGSMRNPDHELVTGPNVNDLTILESGQRWACLTKKEWTTKVTKKLKDSGLNFDLRGFQGDYEVIVKNRGIPVQRELFTLGKEDTTVNIQITNSRVPIDIPEEVDYVPQCISHRAERTLGSEMTPSSDAALSCRTVKSSPSGAGENDAVSVTCDVNEVMTSCTSYHTEGSWTRNGEKIEMDPSGRPQCVAYNGGGSSAGVVSQARCCQGAGVICSYRAAGPSSPFDGAQAEARCPAGLIATGCSVYQPYPDSDGVMPGENLASCLAQSGPPTLLDPTLRSGAFAFSSCCQTASGLDCVVVKSKNTGRRAGSARSVRCPAGYTMTGCFSFAEHGRSAGVWITRGEKCRTRQGHGLPQRTKGALAYATCCRQS